MPIKHIPDEVTCDHCSCDVLEKEVYRVARAFLYEDLVLTDTVNMTVAPQPARMVKQEKVLCKKCSDNMWEYEKIKT